MNIKPIVILGSLVLALSAAAVAAEFTPEPGFKSLFNGTDLTGWEGDKMFWRVENGSIVGETTAAKQPADKLNTFLIYRGGEFANFELRFRYKVEGFNSGIQYRSVDKGHYHVDGLQADFEAQWHEDSKAPAKPKWDQFTGMFFEENGRMFMGQRGDVVIVRANAESPKKPNIEKIGTVGGLQDLEKVIKRDDWNDYTVIANGNQFIHIVNGHVLSIGIDEDGLNFRRSGILAWQLHAGKPMKMEAKDVRIRELK